MPDLPHLTWPYQLGMTVDQDTDDELLASAAVIASTRRGPRDDLPGFGVSDPTFSQGPIDLERLAGELAQADDRLHLDGDEAIDLAAATARTVRLALDHTASP
jgi:hypothetical protein